VSDVTPEASPEEQNACPFCGELATTSYRSKHLDAHRRRGETPLPMTAEIIQNDDGTWGFTLTLDNGDPVLVPTHYKSRKSRKTTERNLRRYMTEIANGASPAGGKWPPSKRAAIDPVEVDTNGATKEITDEAILDVLVKLTGVSAIPVKKLGAVSAWLTQTRKLTQEIQR
jgi:hypothetical protein